MVGASAPFAPPVCVAESGDTGCSDDRVGEVAPVVEAMKWWWLWRRQKGGLHAREGEVSCTVKDEGKKKGKDLSEVSFVGAPGTVRATAVGWLLCAHNPCEDGCNGWLECPQGMTWRRRGIACVRVRGGGGDGDGDGDVTADRFG